MSKVLKVLVLTLFYVLPNIGEATSIDFPVEYPEKAMAECIEGEVTVRFVVSSEGTPKEIEILEANPEGLFEEATRNNLRYWRVPEEPGTVKEQTIEYRIEDKTHCNS